MIERPIEFNSLVFNDQTKADLETSPYYWIRATAVDGIWGDEIRYESYPLPCGTGERSSTSLRSGKQVVITGEIWARNIGDLRTGQWALAQPFWDLAQHKLFFQPWPLFAQSSPDRLYFTMRVNQPLVMTDAIQGYNKYMQQWTVGLRSDDPRSYKESDNSVYPTWQT